ncbi:hypothetical protein MW871_09680 [Flavobacterium sp. I-SCBP12n]|uniref:DUF4134 domain-containing protein n=2 Tax=Flavobacterium TaxID=237 RepID=A0A9X1XRS4_9FLAO|nr:MULTISPECIES: hypothetical protein [Flavobacterium]MBP4140752.1 hypothetical protein [Flavobacterium flabelliforme]MCK8142159.1 hypothetical protein [Flavobacterium pygoscelis]
MYIKTKNIKRKWSIYFCLLFFGLFSVSSNAQCAMCRAALTSEGNTAKAEAINDGIVYLMAIPYLLVGGIGYAVYRMRKNKVG